MNNEPVTLTVIEKYVECVHVKVKGVVKYLDNQIKATSIHLTTVLHCYILFIRKGAVR